MPWRTALVGRENQIEDVRFFLSPLTTPPVVAAKTRVQRCLCREVDGIWQYHTGGNLTIFDKDHDTAEEGRSQVRQKQSSCSQAYDFATAIWRACVPKRNILFFQGGGSWSCNRLYSSDGRLSWRRSSVLATVVYPGDGRLSWRRSSVLATVVCSRDDRRLFWRRLLRTA